VPTTMRLVRLPPRESEFARMKARKSSDAAESTREQLLTHAIVLVEQRGFHSFSYRDLSNIVGVRTASIHYYFPTKSDLARAIVERHRRDNEAFFARIDRSHKLARQRLKNYFDVFRQCYGDGKNMCLGGMMAIDTPLMEEDVVEAIRACYSDHERWLTRLLNEGQKSGELQFEGSPTTLAKVLFDALEGSLVASRLFGHAERLENMLQMLFNNLIR
jgi:TetR/AcrR family transcriptional regulator, transcriptional repressor for nem operon